METPITTVPNAKIKTVKAIIKKVEKEIENCDIDEQYRRDRCAYLMSLFLNMGLNDEMKKYPNAKFPIGKYHMSTFRHAIKYYISFCDESSF